MLITGASSGIGRATALRLHAAGYQVIATVRREEDAAALMTDAPGLKVVRVDLADPAQVEAAATELLEITAETGLGAIIANAGTSTLAPIERLALPAMRRTFEVNLFSHVRLMAVLLPRIRAGHGRIVWLSSVSGEVAMPLAAAYAGSKFAIEAVADVMRRELRPWDVQVITVQPGATQSRIWQGGQANLGAVDDPLYANVAASSANLLVQAESNAIAADVPARVIESALNARWPRVRYRVGPDAKLLMTLHDLLPAWVFDRVVALLV